MNEQTDFVKNLASFLALHTEQSSSHFSDLIKTFLQGSHGRASVEPAAKEKIKGRLKIEMEAYDDAPTFLQKYLVTQLTRDDWPALASYIASRYLIRRTGTRFIAWQKRQQLAAELAGEPIRGTELGLRQMLYSQGAGPAFRWRGIPCLKAVYDVAIYAMLIDELRPGTIIELGSGAGGSALLFADLCTSSGLETKIVSVDKMALDVSDPRVSFIQSDCAEWLATTAQSKTDFPRPCLLIEDFHGDLGGIFPHVDSILEAGDYLVVEDSYDKQRQISEAVANRPYLVDSKYTDFFGVNCTTAINGIFRKEADAGAPQLRARQQRQILRDQSRAWRQKT